MKDNSGLEPSAAWSFTRGPGADASLCRSLPPFRVRGGRQDDEMTTAPIDCRLCNRPRQAFLVIGACLEPRDI